MIDSNLEIWLEKQNILTKNIIPIKRNGNSSVSILELDEQKIVLKKYNKRERDKNERLLREVEFLRLTSNLESKRTPEIIAYSRQLNCSLISYIEGVVPNSNNLLFWRQYIDFIKDIQKIDDRYKKTLPRACESCFSIKDHLIMINNRYKEILGIEYSLEDNKKEINRIIKKEFEELDNYFNNEINDISIFTIQEQIISPSDVGIHNALMYKEKAYFIDFEYAGFDSIFKLIADTLLVPSQTIDKTIITFLMKGFSSLIDLDKSKKQLYLTAKVYRFKWMLIMLRREKKEKHKFINIFKKYIEYSSFILDELKKYFY